MFIFNTNANLDRVNERFAELLQHKARDEMIYSDFWLLLSDSELESISELLQLRGRFDYYVPFLPMTRIEVGLYAQRFLEARRCMGQRNLELGSLEWNDAVIDYLVEQVFLRDPKALFSEHGLAVEAMFNECELAIDKLLVKHNNYIDIIVLQVVDGKIRAMPRTQPHSRTGF
jgi:hypothetical protein